MKDAENLAAILVLGLVALASIYFKVDAGPAKDVALSVTSGLIGFMGRGAYQAIVRDNKPMEVIK